MEGVNVDASPCAKKAKALIINIKNFDDDKLPTRDGSEEDVNSLTALFKNSDFDLETQEDPTKSEMMQKVSEFAETLGEGIPSCAVCETKKNGDDEYEEQKNKDQDTNNEKNEGDDDQKEKKNKEQDEKNENEDGDDDQGEK